MNINNRPYETYIEKDISGKWSLLCIANYGSDLEPVLTPAGNPLKHKSRLLLQEIQSELKSGTPKQLVERFSNYQLLCSQIDEFEHSNIFPENSAKWVENVLMQDGAFGSMHPPEEIERLYNLSFLQNFLRDTFGDSDFGVFLDSAFLLPTGFRGKKFLDLRDTLLVMIDESSLEQKVVMHSAFHMCQSLTVALLFAYRQVMPKEFALGALACQQIIPDTLDAEEQADMLDQQDQLALYASIMSSYLENSRSETERLIEQGEGLRVEFKATFRKNMETGKTDKNIETASLKEIAAFLNTDGGHLIIGVKDDRTICGIDVDGFSNVDHHANHIANQVNIRIDPKLGKYIEYQYVSVTGDKEVLDINCSKLENHESAFLDGELYIRNASQTIKLSTKEAIAWQRKRV